MGTFSPTNPVALEIKVYVRFVDKSRFVVPTNPIMDDDCDLPPRAQWGPHLTSS